MTAPLDSPSIEGDTLLDERPDIRLDEGDHERFAHYVRKEKIVESAVTGDPVIALCGKVWVPGALGGQGGKPLQQIPAGIFSTQYNRRTEIPTHSGRPN